MADISDSGLQLDRFLRVARAILGWSQSELAQAAQIGVATVKRIEAGASATPVVAAALRSALRDQGLLAGQAVEDLGDVEIEFLLAKVTVRR